MIDTVPVGRWSELVMKAATRMRGTAVRQAFRVGCVKRRQLPRYSETHFKFRRLK